jgi:hypothetical protein
VTEKRLGRATARLWSFYIFEVRSGSSDGFRQQ